MGCIITLLGFTYADKVEKRITSINISIIDDVDSKFLTVPRVRTHLDAYGKIIGELEKDVQLEAIHSHLTNIPSVLNVTIFSNLNGELVIELIQRRAQARVHLEQTSDYYIDELGRSMPLDPNYSARVPIIHAENSDEVRHAFSFIKNTENFGLL
jgi:cell division protein FtsQ